MRRVLFLNHTAQLGGGELSLLDLARHLPGCRVVLFAPGPFWQRLNEAGVDVEVLAAGQTVLGVRRESRLGALAALPGILRMAHQVATMARAFDIIHCNSQKAFVVGALAGAIARKPVIWHLRDMLTHASFSGLNRRVTVQLANRLAKLVITNSQATADAFAAVGGDQRKTAVLYNGIDPAPAYGSAGRVRSGLGLPAGQGPVLGCFSRLSPWKGQHVLLEAAAMLRPRYPDLTVLLVGSPLFGEDAYAEELRHRASVLGLGRHVKFLGFRSDIPALMSLCDVVVHTSVEPEPFGRVIIEGQFAGKPVIATAAGGAVELIDHGKTGLLVPPGDPSALADAVRLLMDDAPLATRIGLAGHGRAEQEFTVAKMVGRFQQLLAGL